MKIENRDLLLKTSDSNATKDFASNVEILQQIVGAITRTGCARFTFISLFFQLQPK